MCTRDEERTLALKMVELQEATPTIIGLSGWFTLDANSSGIRAIFEKQYSSLDDGEGDVGGSGGPKNNS
jgi:hypothetical protein